MSITVGEIPIEGSSRLVLPDLRDREVVGELRASAERDAGATHYWETRPAHITVDFHPLEAKPVRRSARRLLVAVSVFFAVLTSIIALLLEIGHEPVASLLLVATIVFQLVVALVGAVSLRAD